MENNIIQSLIKQNYRITPARKKLIEYFSCTNHPLSAIQILDMFKNDKIKIHKATIYREIDFLQAHEIIHTLNLNQNVLSYELNSLMHHHHFVCEKCGHTIDIIPIEVEKKLYEFEKNLAKKEKVTINKHSLKIFGFCRNCKY